MDDKRIARSLRGGDASPTNPYLIRSPFDYDLEIAITDERRVMGSEEAVYLWRLRKWYFDERRASYRQMKYFTLKDLLLVEELLKEAKTRMGILYRHIIRPQETSESRKKMRKPYTPFSWDCDTAPVEDEERQDAPPAEPIKYPWED